MRGKQVLMDTLAAHGVEYLFGNPGTTESPIIDALPTIRSSATCVALHEGVALARRATTRRPAGAPAWSISTSPRASATRSACCTARSRRGRRSS